MLRLLFLAAAILSSTLSVTAVSLWPSITPEAVAALSLLTKPVPNTGANLKKITKTYVVPHAHGKDDSVALNAVIASKKYTSNSRFLFQQGVTYNIWTVSSACLIVYIQAHSRTACTMEWPFER